ncbi:uncharacterized protein SCHCODRAFT_02752395 [Schizophyllum commune H4-8]|nr:uncharacterized protein SCHCODRAFT_02752395 [Schizophyllum commune H4-8]KAI5886775.1 hypothetical protein SCHCODRAFT_02752395 [Schizophyllum commune H4-8]
MGYIQIRISDYGGVHPESRRTDSQEDALSLDGDTVLADASALLEYAQSLVEPGLQRRRLVLSSTEIKNIRKFAPVLVAQIERISTVKKRIVASGEQNFATQNYDLSAARKRLLRQLGLHRSLIAPIWRLPPELLSDIFLHYKAQHEDRAACDAHFMMRLAQVCYVWREVARDTPFLWTRFTAMRCSRMPEVVNAELVALSRTAPLTIHHDGDDPEDRILLRLLDQLQPHAAHWGSIKLSGRVRTFAQLPLVALPALREASLTFYDTWPRVVEFDEVLLFLEHAPWLERLNVSSDSITWDEDEEEDEFITFQIPQFFHLTHLSVSLPRARLSKDDLMLGLSPFTDSLVSMTLHTDLFVPPAHLDHTAEPTPFPALRILHLSQSAGEILPFIIAPSLDELTLSETGETPFVSLAASAARPENAIASLRKATLTAVRPLDHHAVLECLEQMEGLKELHLRGDLSPARISTFSLDLSRRMTCLGARVSASRAASFLETRHGLAGHGEGALSRAASIEGTAEGRYGPDEPCSKCAPPGDMDAPKPLLPSLVELKVDSMPPDYGIHWRAMLRSRQVPRVCGGWLVPELKVVSAWT